MVDSRIYIGAKGDILGTENIPSELVPESFSDDTYRIPYQGCIFLFLNEQNAVVDAMIIKTEVTQIFHPEVIGMDEGEYSDSDEPVLIREPKPILIHPATFSFVFDESKTRETLSKDELFLILGKSVPYVEKIITADHVRNECQRRLIALLNARDEEHLDILIKNGTREAVRLLKIKDTNGQWTPEQLARAQELENLDLAIEAIRAASNAMEENPPANYKDDSNWPNFS